MARPTVKYKAKASSTKQKQGMSIKDGGANKRAKKT